MAVAAPGKDGGAVRRQTPQAPSSGKSLAQPSKPCGAAGRSSTSAARPPPRLTEATEETVPGSAVRLLSSAAVQALPEQPGQEPAEHGRKPREGLLGGLAEQSSKEKLAEGHGARPAVGLPSALGPLEQLQHLQVAMQPVNSYASQVLAQLRQSQGQRHKPHFRGRSRLIQAIPGFWGTTVSFGFSAQTAAELRGCGWGFSWGSQQALGQGELDSTTRKVWQHKGEQDR